MLEIILVILLGICGAFAGAAYYGGIRNRKLKDQVQKTGEKSEKVYRAAMEAVKKAQDKMPNSVMIQAFQYDDPEYNRILGDMFCRPELIFFIEDLKQSALNALVQANDKNLEENCVGKLKGIELVIRQMRKIADSAKEAI